MDNIKFLFSKEDKVMLTDLEKVFGKGKVTDERDLIGETIAIFAIPGTALAVQIADFVISHIKERKEAKKIAEKELASKRKLEINGKRISFSGGYTVEEIIEILQSLGVK